MRLSLQAGPVVFHDLYALDPALRLALSGDIHLRKNISGVLRAGYMPATQRLQTPAGEQQATMELYEFALGARLLGPRVFSSRLRSFAAVLGGMLWYQPRPVQLDLGSAGKLRLDPSSTTKAMVSLALGIEWQFARSLALTMSVEAAASRLAQRFSNGQADETWRPFYGAWLGVTGCIK